MHESAYRFVQRAAAMLRPFGPVCELGSRDVNGSVRPLFANCPVYVGVDCRAGSGVDVVADAAHWRPDAGTDFAVAVSTECLEHTPDAGAVCLTAHAILRRGGVFIVTAASTLRHPHSGVDGGPLRPGEFYENVSEGELRAWLAPFGVALVDTFTNPTDIYAIAVKV